ncbi:MAG: aminotransferase class I/II-fold pyridoxal phosphate-dependent enzyme, partial [Myxococcales bacterium]|nr:aminotransferase class I/II-fold pyridoxal phosphate-dependent enzyme [Myxococcales bacterium]
MNTAFLAHLDAELQTLRETGLYKGERVITSPQQAEITVGDGKVLNFCANNYLGLANHPALREAAKAAIDRHGYGMSSVRFICGTQDVHKQLEARISAFLGTEDAILYSSCFDANGGLFEALLGPDDAIISDALNHASIIDGVRLCKAKRYRYANNDMADLEAQLRQADADGAKVKLIATDGVFSMDGYIANHGAICDLAEKHGALTMVDDSHATGFVGEKGRGRSAATGQHLFDGEADRRAVIVVRRDHAVGPTLERIDRDRAAGSADHRVVPRGGAVGLVVAPVGIELTCRIALDRKRVDLAREPADLVVGESGVGERSEATRLSARRTSDGNGVVQLLEIDHDGHSLAGITRLTDDLGTARS